MSFSLSFSGRIGRLQWWLVTTTIWVAYFSAIRSLELLLTPHEVMQLPSDRLTELCILVLFSIFLESAVTAKRYHDMDESGWMALKGLIPLVGSFWVAIECGFFGGTPGRNAYGDPPGSRQAKCAPTTRFRCRARRPGPIGCET